MKIPVALCLLALTSAAHAQTSWCGGNCGPLSQETMRWMYDNDPERKKTTQPAPRPRPVQMPPATDAEIAAGIDLTMAVNICSGSPHPYSLNWQHGVMTCADIRWLDRFYRIQREWDEKQRQ